MGPLRPSGDAWAQFVATPAEVIDFSIKSLVSRSFCMNFLGKKKIFSQTESLGLDTGSHDPLLDCDWLNILRGCFDL